MFGRRSTPDNSPDDTPAASVTSEPKDGTRDRTDVPAEGKGRPTPKRREAEQARKQRVKPPLTRREAMRRQRERTKATKSRTRRAMETGDERYYLTRDKGPVRHFLRNYVDSRRTVAEYFLPIVLVILVTSFINSPRLQLFSSVLMMTTMLIVIADLSVLGFRVKRQVRKRFGDDAGRGHVLYAITRATQMRRLRLPKPTVKPGAAV